MITTNIADAARVLREHVPAAQRAEVARELTKAAEGIPLSGAEAIEAATALGELAEALSPEDPR